MDKTFDFRVGDIIKVTQKVNEGKKDRLVTFRGQLIKTRGKDENMMFTVRQELDGVFVDRIYPLANPSITDIALVEKPKKTVRRAKLLKYPTK